MAFKVLIVKRADLEIEEALLYYENIGKGLGEKFLLDYNDHLKTLYNFPFFEEKYNVVRTLSLKKFPYTIHFTVDELEKIVHIQAVTCNYQNPENTRIKL
ncbi:type II toxin-antitoxin system RelE/ParE family toxin [Flavobacterium hibisci]|uniref:type II toxin-antitoxin system RelE/ParE family toxin n=1 Tax=Flavobacterium hibisci TaxID=1914462 RepID=UPI001CBF5738|nr:type II toxin-antitoxin system RelE/ParE family toxin [Flavobacterium hibisci]MBZ4043580.1 type II toxin-antitoxin system RelE/ParE family toxin [Flavobacterium hibisci]